MLLHDSINAPERASGMGFTYKKLGVMASYYTCDLQAHALELEDIVQQQRDKIRHLETVIGKSGNASYQRDANAWGKAWQDLNIEFGRYKLQAMEQIGQLQAEKRRLEIERDWLQEQTELLESKLMRYEQLLSGRSVVDQGRDQNGRFSGSQWDNWTRVWGLAQQGKNVFEIADATGLSVSTVETYLRKYAKTTGQLIPVTATIRSGNGQ